MSETKNGGSGSPDCYRALLQVYRDIEGVMNADRQRAISSSGQKRLEFEIRVNQAGQDLMRLDEVFRQCWGRKPRAAR